MDQENELQVVLTSTKEKQIFLHFEVIRQIMDMNYLRDNAMLDICDSCNLKV